MVVRGCDVVRGVATGAASARFRSRGALVAGRATMRFTMPAVSAYDPPSSPIGKQRTMAGSILAQAFMANQPMLLRYLRARGAGDDAEDCLQDLWIRAQASPDGAIDDPLAYLYRMAHNLMLDRYRAAQRRQGREIAYRSDVEGHDGDADSAPSAERILLGRDRLRRIDRVLATLGSRTEHIFRRHRVDEVGQRDIAAELGITLSAVEKHLQKAYRAVAAVQRASTDGADSSLADREAVDGQR
jgi:RNA polymerase sigma-70 factor (ECF subfamily)